MKNEFVTITTTYPNSAEGKKLAQNLIQTILTKKLAACVQSHQVTSNYIWQENLCQDEEIVLNIKTLSKFYKTIEKEIIAQHPYQVPQIISHEILDGLEPYLDWIATNVATTK